MNMDGDKINLPYIESKQFIKWAIGRLEDKEYFSYILKRIRKRQQVFYSMDRAELLNKLEGKLERGAMEYKEPLNDFKQIKKEIED